MGKSKGPRHKAKPVEPKAPIAAEPRPTFWTRAAASLGQEIQVGNLVVKSGVRFRDNVGKATIKPGAIALLRCPVTNAGAGMVRGTIHATIEYRTLWFSRTYEGTDLTWVLNANPPRWIEGELIR